jgi:hypothetical protein
MITSTALVGVKCTAISERKDVVSAPLTPTEVDDRLYTLERRETLSGSVDCELGMREGCSVGTGVDGTGSTT